MAERNGAAVDIDFGRVEARLPDHRERLSCERFVEFDQIHILQLQSSQAQHFRDGFDRAQSHDLGPDAGRRVCDEAGQRLQSHCAGLLFRHYNDRRGAIAHWRRVAGRDRTVRLESRLQFGKRFH